MAPHAHEMSTGNAATECSVPAAAAEADLADSKPDDDWRQSSSSFFFGEESEDENHEEGVLTQCASTVIEETVTIERACGSSQGAHNDIADREVPATERTCVSSSSAGSSLGADNDIADREVLATERTCVSSSSASKDSAHGHDTDCAHASDPIILSSTDSSSLSLHCEEGRALSEALREARLALEHARRFVTSPALDRPVTPCKPEVSNVPMPTPKLKEASETINLEPTPPTSARYTSRERVNALHARFGENAARARVARHSSREPEQSVEKRNQRHQRLQRDAEEAAKSEGVRRDAALRVASERRALNSARRTQEEEEALAAAQRDVRAQASRQYAKSAARRVKSEQQRQRSQVNEALLDLDAMQQKWLDEDEKKAQELQRRCEERAWSDGKSVISTKPPRSYPSHEPHVLPESGSKAAGHDRTVLPEIVQRRRAPSSSAKKTPRRSVSCDVTFLPPIAPA